MAASVVDATIAELVVAAQGGNHAAFTTLYARFHRAVHAVALARVGAADAADVVQDVFARAWTRLDSVREPAAFAGWLMTMARHRAIDRARARGGGDAPEREVAVAPAPTAEAAAAPRAIRALPGAYRFANMILADEVYRTPPKTQAAMLEAMQDRQVSAGGKVYPLPAPFFVLATQNPLEQEGTYPLPEAQLDRFSSIFAWATRRRAKNGKSRAA